MTKIVGLTGGMGSGKTTVARIFEELGIPVYFADDQAKKLMQTDDELKENIIREFGNNVYISGKLNTGYLAKIVFSHPEKLKKLEAIVHPAVRKDFKKWVRLQTAPYVIVENAILHKSGMDKLTDYIIWVVADLKKRVERIKKRDEINEEEIKKRLSNQNISSKIIENSDFIIKNNENPVFLRNSVKKIDLKLKKMLKKS